MSKNRYKAPESTSSPIGVTANQFPTDEPVAVYYRQSTDGQVGNVSTTIQTVDMVSHLQQRGWKTDDIYLIDMDAGVSGTKRIDERPGMRRLFELITERKIQAVACQDEDRLFRDITQIQVNIFIEACKNANVRVITPSIVYDFAHPQMGNFHARQFRFKSEMAAEYLTSFVLGRLHNARMRLAMEGRWTGASMSPGYMIDSRKFLPDGSRNENWRRYVVFEPYAEIVNAYFQIFLETSGCVGSTLRRIYSEGLCYPDPAACEPPQGYAVRYGIRQHGNGYYPGRSGLRYLLTNAAYLGHWCVNDAVVRWNNHPAIVPEDVFFTAFNYLSAHTLDGAENEQYRPSRQFARPVTDEERPCERPLLSGMIFTEIDSEWRSVGTEYVKREKHYRYLSYDRKPVDEYVWSKNSEWVDEAVSRLLQEKLKATFDSTVWRETIESFEDGFRREQKLKNAQITALEQAMENLIGGIETLTNPDMIRAVEKRYEDARLEHSRLSMELATAQQQAGQMTFISELKDTYETTIADWPNMNRDEKRVIVQAFIDRIEAVPYDKHGLHLFVCWRDGQRDRVSIPRLPTYGDGWTLEEHELLEQLLDAGAIQEQIAAAFPKRTWRVIRDRITRQRDLKTALFTPKPVRDVETFEEYKIRIRSNPGVLLKARHQWRKDEIAQLVNLLEQGATKLEVAQSFPYRTWTRLRSKISELKGSDFVVSGQLPMSFKESYFIYQHRIGESTEATSSIGELTTETDEHSGRGCPIRHRGKPHTAARSG